MFFFHNREEKIDLKIKNLNQKINKVDSILKRYESQRFRCFNSDFPLIVYKKFIDSYHEEVPIQCIKNNCPREYHFMVHPSICANFFNTKNKIKFQVETFNFQRLLRITYYDDKGGSYSYAPCSKYPESYNKNDTPENSVLDYGYDKNLIFEYFEFREKLRSKLKHLAKIAEDLNKYMDSWAWTEINWIDQNEKGYSNEKSLEFEVDANQIIENYLKRKNTYYQINNIGGINYFNEKLKHINEISENCRKIYRELNIRYGLKRLPILNEKQLTYISNQIAGENGEIRVKNSVKLSQTLSLHNVILPYGYGSNRKSDNQIDDLVIAPTGIYAVEVKTRSISGNIFDATNLGPDLANQISFHKEAIIQALQETNDPIINKLKPYLTDLVKTIVVVVNRNNKDNFRIINTQDYEKYGSRVIADRDLNLLISNGFNNSIRLSYKQICQISKSISKHTVTNNSRSYSDNVLLFSNLSNNPDKTKWIKDYLERISRIESYLDDLYKDFENYNRLKNTSSRYYSVDITRNEFNENFETLHQFIKAFSNNKEGKQQLAALFEVDGEENIEKRNIRILIELAALKNYYLMKSEVFRFNKDIDPLEYKTFDVSPAVDQSISYLENQLKDLIL